MGSETTGKTGVGGGRRFRVTMNIILDPNCGKHTKTSPSIYNKTEQLM